MDAAREYLQLPLALGLSWSERLGLLATAFALVFASVVVLHLFVPEPAGVAELLLHAVQISLAYVFWLGVLVLPWLVVASGRGLKPRVWHVWALSFAGYVLGYFAVDFDDPLTVVLHPDVEQPGSWFHFARLLPVWVLVTYVFTQRFVGRSRKAEIERLARLNERLAAGSERAQCPAGSRVQVAAGRTVLDVPVSAISHVTVEDHYCYVHLHEQGERRKVALGMALAELQAMLPRSFVRVHRSHVINVDAVSAVERTGRSCQVVLGDGVERVPVSRQRLAAVLPCLEQRVARLGETE